jgi:hypothetical protein
MNLDWSHFLVAAGAGLVSLLGIAFTSRTDVKWLSKGQSDLEARVTRIENHLFNENRG